MIDAVQVVARALEMAVRLGYFFGSLAFDKASGTGETKERVRYRAAQLRSGRHRFPPLLRHLLSSCIVWVAASLQLSSRTWVIATCACSLIHILQHVALGIAASQQSLSGTKSHMASRAAGHHVSGLPHHQLLWHSCSQINLADSSDLSFVLCVSAGRR